MNIKKIILEEINDFEWMDNVPLPKKYGSFSIGDKFIHRNDLNINDPIIYTLSDINSNVVKLSWGDKKTTYLMDVVNTHIDSGAWVILNNNNLQESDDFDWVDDSSEYKEHGEFNIGDRFIRRGEINPDIFTFNGVADGVVRLSWVDGGTNYSLNHVIEYIKDGTWIILDNNLQESDDFDWIEKVKPPENDGLSYDLATVGMRVKLRPNYDGDVSEFNPIDSEGTVVQVFNTPPIDYVDHPNLQVQWDTTGKKQYYYNNEVVLVGLSESEFE